MKALNSNRRNPLLASARITHLLHATRREDDFAWMLQKLGVYFKRECIIGGITVDFFLPFYNMVVEIDGKQHSIGERKLRDEKRDRWLMKRGYKVLRLQNRDVRKDGGEKAFVSALPSKYAPF